MAALTQTFYGQESANKRKSLLLLLSVFVLFSALGFFGGYALTGTAPGAGAIAVVAFVVALGISGFSYFDGDSLVLRASKAQPVDAESHPVLMNVVQEIAIASGTPMPKVYI